MDEQTYQEQSLKLLQSINERLAGAAGNRKPFFATLAISATIPLVLDYRDRKHIFMYSATALTLTLEDIGSLAVNANTWADISFRPGLNIFAQSQVASVFVLIMQTDDSPSGVAGNGAVSAAAGSFAVGWSTEFTEVAADTDEIAASLVLIAAQTTLTPTLAAEYPSGALPIAGSSGNVANATAAATLTGAVGQFTWMTGFEITGSGATLGLPVTVTITNTIAGTLSFTYTATVGVLLPNTPLIVPFPKPIRSFSQNQNMVVSCPALGGGNTNNTTVVHGYTL